MHKNKSTFPRSIYLIFSSEWYLILKNYVPNTCVYAACLFVDLLAFLNQTLTLFCCDLSAKKIYFCRVAYVR